MSEILYCTRGCVRPRRHLTDCDDPLECKGCEPSLAKYGLLCWSCHRRFQLMLTQAEITERWLTGNLPAGSGASRAKEDHETRGGADEAPAPLKVAILDVRESLRDRLACWVDEIVEVRQLTGPKYHSVVNDSKFLLTWLTTIEHMDPIGDWFEELGETMSDAHALAPWRPAMTRLPKVTCPVCHHVSLAIFGGESDVTCLECRTMYSSARYGIWADQIQQEKTA